MTRSKVAGAGTEVKVVGGGDIVRGSLRVMESSLLSTFVGGAEILRSIPTNRK